MKRALCTVAAAAIVGCVVACAQENWGGPKGPAAAPPPAATSWHPEAAEGTLTDDGKEKRHETPDASAALAPPAPGAEAHADAGGLVARVEASLTGTKIPGFDDAVTGMRPAMKACVEGKGAPDAVVEIMAQIGPKGTVVRSDKVGGTEFAEGAVPCLMKIVENAQFKKPPADAGPPPRVTFRVKLSRD